MLMLPLYEDPGFTFRFGEDRLILYFTWRPSRSGDA